MQKQIFDTSFPENYSKGLYDSFNFDLNATHTGIIADVTFSSIASVLNSVKNPNKPSAFIVNKPDDAFVAAAITQYFPNEDDPKKPGNWSLTFTFSEEDIPEDAATYKLTDSQIHSHFRAIAGDKYHFQFATPESVIILPSYLFSQLYKWLDENAKEGEEVCINYEGVFEARVAIEGGEKVFAIVPDGEIKVLIKDDASIQK
jgi:hypothetical protein